MIEFINELPAVIYVFQLFIAEILIVVLLPKKKYWWIFFSVFSVILFALSAVIPDLILGGVLYIPLIVSFIVIGLSFFFMFDLQLNGVLFGVICVGLMQHTAECFTMGVRYLFGISSDQWLWMLCSLVCYLITYGFYFLYFRKKMGKINLKRWKVIVIALVVFFGIFSLRNLAAIILEQWSIEQYMVAIYNIYATICCILCCSYMFSSEREEGLSMEKEQLKRLLQQEQVHYARLVANQDVINRKCHDLKYQIAEMRRSTTPDAMEEKIARLEKDVMIYENFPKTGNVALDYTLSERCLLCQQNNIMFTYIVDGGSLCFMDSTDIYSLFGNAIDNAIDCVKKYEDKDKRIISLNINKRGNILCVHIENYCEDEVIISAGEIKTTKEDKENHGFGVKSIKYIVEKYKGYMSICCEQKIFTLDIMFTL